MESKMLRNRKRTAVELISIIVIVVIFLVYRDDYRNRDLGYTQEYVPGTGNIKGDVDTAYFTDRGREFEIGANKYGYAVFKHPAEALHKLKSEYKDGINLIQWEFKLLPLSQMNYASYGEYGCQVSTGTEEEKAQAAFVSGFMDIYENSFER